MFAAKVVSTKFLAELKARAKSFKQRRISAVLTVPPDLRWWYWLEFGTALRGETGKTPTGYEKASGHPYPIVPVDAPILSFPTEFGQRFAMSVVHPGIRPRKSVTKAIPEIMEKAHVDIVNALITKGFRYSSIKDALVQKSLPRAKELIAENLLKDAPNVRPDGRLEGDTAGDTFAVYAEAKSR
jgi:hypothetical protein